MDATRNNNDNKQQSERREEEKTDMAKVSNWLLVHVQNPSSVPSAHFGMHGARMVLPEKYARIHKHKMQTYYKK